MWRGYHQIKEAGGYVALVFAGMGIYRLCKYRIDFEDESFAYLRALQPRFELAADTLHPVWRQLLAVVGKSTDARYRGHPLDWCVGGSANPEPLADGYLRRDPQFDLTLVNESEVDQSAWPSGDPRRVNPPMSSGVYECVVCGQTQSDETKENKCYCFPSIYGDVRGAPPVQIFKTLDGRNNGLIACCVGIELNVLVQETDTVVELRTRHCHRRIYRPRNSRPR